MSEPVEPIVDDLRFSVGADTELNCVVLTFSVPVAALSLDAQGARELVDGIMQAGKRLAAHNKPRILVPDASSYARRPANFSVNIPLNGAKR